MPVVDPYLTGRWPRRRPRPWYTDWLVLPFIAAVVGLDQLTKFIVRSNLEPYERFPTWGEFHITHIRNTGGAFGLFPDQTFLLIAASLMGVAVLLLLYQNHPFPGPLLRMSLGLQLGGALGNLLDRVRLGYVTDFVELAWWPVWNLADASILVGIGILLGLLLLVRPGHRWPSYSPPRGRPARTPPHHEAPASSVAPSVPQPAQPVEPAPVEATGASRDQLPRVEG